ncbi:Ankyrin repeat and IBR domain-containing protein 1 [Nymphon striatum]|nr:Ankyrin repeat and IBR domain-containing protein 1 [Nymphon striatum]
MGTLSSKFKNHLQNGDEYAAMQIYQKSRDFRKSIDPNLSFGESHLHDTPLHYAAAHAMKPLLRAFLFDRNGNPNKKNSLNQTSLHVACQNTTPKSPTSHERRKACVALILQWKGTTNVKDNHNSNEEVFETIDIAAVDDKKNTALHYAAASGLKKCVEILVSYRAPIFVENEDKDIPCDVAEKNGHTDIMMFLESKIVFSSPDTASEDIKEENMCNEPYFGLTTQELQEAKDMLLVETSDMLHIPLFTAEALLRNHEWSKEMLLEMWMKDPMLCCERAHVQPPTSALQFRNTSNGNNQGNRCKSLPSVITSAVVTQEYQHCQSLNSPIRTTLSEQEIICEICTCVIPALEEPVPVVCEHQFCRSCWQRYNHKQQNKEGKIIKNYHNWENEKQLFEGVTKMKNALNLQVIFLVTFKHASYYLEVKIQQGDAHNITCPAFQCSRLVPVDVIENLVSPDMIRKYLQFDIQAFVASNPQIKWCPSPGCGRAVRLPQIDTIDPQVRNIPNAHPPAETSHAVDCGNGHYFCWECFGEAHAPCNCEKWKEWHIKVNEIKPEELKSTGQATENAANCLWLVTNSKQCPNCKSPIQKNEGCNHMKCSKCKFDFCWVCLESWKKHSSATGGYFRCNRYEAVNRAEENFDIMKSEAANKSAEMQELNRFVHYYTRFKNHENSHKLEEPLLKSASEKMKILAAASLHYAVQNSQHNVSNARSMSRTLTCNCSRSVPVNTSASLRSLPSSANTKNSSACYSSSQLSKPGHSSSSDLISNEDEKSFSKDYDIDFIKDAVKEVLKARRVLCGSYVYGYYLVDDGYNKTIFEFMQNEFEEHTEKLSEMISRPCLRTPKCEIIATAITLKRKLQEFLSAVSKGLIPPETPPEYRKRRRRLPGVMGIDPIEDLQITQAMQNSLKDLDPNNPWVKDSKGRHTNLLAVYEWPDFDSDEELHLDLSEETGICKRSFCNRPRARNPRTGEIHDFCSLQCYKHDQNEESVKSKASFESDYNMDLLIALEMSRLQMIEDMNKVKMAGARRVDCVGSDGLNGNSINFEDASNIVDIPFDQDALHTLNRSGHEPENMCGFSHSDNRVKQIVPVISKDDFQAVIKKDVIIGHLNRSASESQLDSLRESISERCNTIHIDEPITSSSGDETDGYVSSNPLKVPVILQGLESSKEINDKNLNINEANSKTSKELIFCMKLAEKTDEESSL